MKKVFTLLLITVSCLGLHAQYTTDGYYFVNNKATERYIYVMDNTGSINIATAGADMGAIELHKDTARLHYDPAAIVYITKIATNQYDLMAQGTGVHSLIGYYVNVYPKSDGTYQVYAEGKYLDDNETTSRDLGFLGFERTGDYRLWYIHPTNTDQHYFGILPTMHVGNKYYKSFYADFPFQVKGDGMKVYYICKVYDNAAIWKEATGVIPASTPVYIECSRSHPHQNTLTIVAKNQVAQYANVSGNKLKGVYFNNPNRQKSKDARTAYNPVTMRCLTATADGRICFAKQSSLSYLPANEAYLPVNSTAWDTLPIMTEQEYEVYSKASNLTLSDTLIELHPGENKTLSATIEPATATFRTPTWGSSNPSVAAIEGSGNRVYINALSVGEATITARTQDGTDIIAQCQVNVLPTLVTGIVLSQGSISACVDDTARLTATVVPANATNKQLKWHSTDTNVAVVEDGLVTIKQLGNATIEVSSTDGSAITASCPVMGVKRLATSISIQSRIKSADTLSIGDTITLFGHITPHNATEQGILWTCNKTDIVTVTQDGLCTAVKNGKATITAQTIDGSNKKASFVINVRPKLMTDLFFLQDTIRLYKNDTVLLTYYAQPSDATDPSLTWKSTNTQVATISQKGRLITHDTGITYIILSANDASQLRDTCVILVDSIVRPVKAQALVFINPTSNLYVGDSTIITATLLPTEVTNRTLTWTVIQDDNQVQYLIDHLNIHIWALQPGIVQIVASTTDSTNLSDTCYITIRKRLVESIQLSDYGIELYPDEQQNLYIQVLPENALNRSVIVTCSDTTIATIEQVSSHYVIRARKTGITTVKFTAQDESGIETTATITVKPRLVEILSLSTTSKDMIIGDYFSLYAVVSPSNATNSTLAWESSDASIASVESGGSTALITALKQGDVTITVGTTDGSHLTATCSLHIDPIWVTYLRLSEHDTIQLYVDENTALTTVVKPDNASNKTIAWTTDDSNIATITQDGYLTAKQPGITIVNAATTDGSGLTDSCPVKVKLFTGLITLDASGHVQGHIYTLQGQRISQITSSGLYIVDGKIVYIRLQ